MKNMAVDFYSNFCLFITVIVSSGLDTKLLFWDAQTQNPVCSIDLPEQCYVLKIQENLMVVTTANCHVFIYNVSRQPQEHEQRESILKYETQCVQCFPDMIGFVIASIERQVGIQYNNPVQESKNFSFNYHWNDQDVYTVNGSTFHPVEKFATVGVDGVITFWDKDNKQKLKGFLAVGNMIPYANSMRRVCLFVYAKSYDWSKGISYGWGI